MDERPGDGAGHAADLQDLPDPEPHVGHAAAPLCCSRRGPLPTPASCRRAWRPLGAAGWGGEGGAGGASLDPALRGRPGSSGHGGPSHALICLKPCVMVVCTAASSLRQCLQTRWRLREGSPPPTGPSGLWERSLTRPVGAACSLEEGMFEPKVLTSVLT